MWNFSRTAVPPEVSSRSSVALFMFVLSVSQCPTNDFNFSNASAPPPGPAFVLTAIVPAHKTSTPIILARLLIDCSPFKNCFKTAERIDSSKSETHRAAAAASLFFPNRCVANPTIAPSSIPGSKMSQNNAVPARRMTRRLSTAAIPMPTRMPNSIECTRCETYPVAMPANSPFSKEKVITLDITAPSDGSKKPLKPSRRPSTPPTPSPSTGFVRLIVPSRESASASSMNLLRTLVGLHHPQKVTLGVGEGREGSDSWNRRLRHNQFSAGLLYDFDAGVNRFHANSVGSCLDFCIHHEAAVDPRRSLRSGGHHPIFHGARPLLNLPAEHFLVERRRALGIARRNF